MISTKNLITNVTDVPIEWVFEYYLNLSEKLNGQDVKILSVFNAKDKVPSMYIYFEGVYSLKIFHPVIKVIMLNWLDTCLI